MSIELVMSSNHLILFKTPKILQICHEKSCDSLLLPFFAYADHLSTHPLKISLILRDLSHVLIGQSCFRLCLQFPSYSYLLQTHVIKIAGGVLSASPPSPDKPLIGNMGEAEAGVTLRSAPESFFSHWPGRHQMHWACLRRPRWTLKATLSPFADHAFLSHPNGLRRDLLQCPARTQTPSVSNIPPTWESTASTKSLCSH